MKSEQFETKSGEINEYFVSSSAMVDIMASVKKRKVDSECHAFQSEVRMISYITYLCMCCLNLPTNSSIHPSIGTILCTERQCCRSSLLGYRVQSLTGDHSNTGYSNGSITPNKLVLILPTSAGWQTESTPPGIN